jgi:hypothetical protein
MNDCRAFKDLIEEYLDGVIGKSRLDELKAHTAACEACAKELRRSSLMRDIITDAFEPCMTPEEAGVAISSRLASQVNCGFFQKRESKTRTAWERMAVAAGIVLAAGLIAGFTLGRAGSIRPAGAVPLVQVPVRVAGLEGMVLVRHEGSDVWNALTSDSAVFLGDTFHCASRSDLTLELRDKSTLEIAENSMLVFRSYDGETRLYLQHGHCRASLGSPHPPFFIDTPHGWAEALGTVFTVTVK